MRTVRIGSQIAFFVLFVVTFLAIVSFPTAYWLPAPWLPRLNPLVALTVSVAARTVVLPVAVMGLVMVVATMVFGRFFCGFVCPLGAVVDFSDRFIFGKSRAPRRQPPAYLRRLKYVLLLVVLVPALFGVVFPLFMDPLSLLTRVATLVGYPLLKVVQADAVAAGRALRVPGLSTVVVAVPPVYGAASALALLLLVVGGGFWDRRFWCQYVCPSGAFFGLLSRFALFRRVVWVERCSSCRRCSRQCPTRAIDHEHFERTAVSECIMCGLCTDMQKDCSRFAFTLPPPRGGSVGPDLHRRHALVGALGGLALVPLLRADARERSNGHGRLIRPPGALPEDLFLARCIACGNCMKACPTNALQPCVLENGVGRLFTPRVVARVGACEPSCHLCGYACPTGAIRRLSRDEKEFARIGTAVVDRHRCLAWTQNKECLVCDEVCPYNAIEARVEQTTGGAFKVPVVIEDRCVGCGMCEHHCPVSARAAIEVYSFSENRRETGPYATERQKSALRAQRRQPDAVSTNPGMSTPAKGQSGTATESETELPPGFLD